MGIVGFSVDEAEGQAHDGWPDEEENQVPSLSKPKEWQTRMALMRTMLDSHRREAFDAFPPMAGHSSTESVDEYVYIFRNEELCLGITPEAQHPALSVLFPLSMQDPTLFKCFLVAAQSMYEWRRNRNPRQPQRSTAMIHLQSDAISSLQKRLSLPAAHLDDGLVMSILHLMVADACSLNLSSLKSHLRGVRQILSLRGGLSDKPAHLSIRALLTTVEFYIALGQYLHISPDDSSAIPIQRIDYVKHPFPPDVCQYISTYPDGLAEAALSGHLSVQCMKLLADAAKWAPLIDETSEQTLDPVARYSRLFCQPREFSRNAITLLLDLQRSGAPPGLEHVVCFGLAMIVRHLSGGNRTNTFDLASLNVLTANIKAIDGPTVAESEVIIWLALVVNWRTQSAGPLPKADELLDYVLDTFPAARSWKKVSSICRRFWWFDRFQTEWKSYWQGSMERQQTRSIKRGKSGGSNCKFAGDVICLAQ